jgi:hypothetical protein
MSWGQLVEHARLDNRQQLHDPLVDERLLLLVKRDLQRPDAGGNRLDAQRRFLNPGQPDFGVGVML